MPASPLFNGPIFNDVIFNGADSGAGAFSTDKLVFEDFSISDTTNMLMQELRINGPTREIIGGPVPRDHGQYVNADYFRENTIEAFGIVKASTAAALDAYLDSAGAWSVACAVEADPTLGGVCESAQVTRWRDYHFQHRLNPNGPP